MDDKPLVPVNFEADSTDSTQTSQPGEETTDVQPIQQPEDWDAGQAANQETNQADLLKSLLEKMETLQGDIKALQEGFDSKIRFDASKEHVIDILHKDLQTYREGLYFQLVRPLVFAMIGMHDDLTSMLQFQAEGETPEQKAARLEQNLASFQSSIESALEEHGVVAFNEAGSPFNPQRQRAVRVESTGEPALDRQVSQSLRKGFEHEGRTVRPENVVVYKYSKERIL